MVGKIGVLALQGAFAKHLEVLQRLRVESLEVRTQTDLEVCDGLILPGGESTVMHSLNTLPLASYKKPIFGTCAGMILMAHLGLLDITVERNAYGPQAHSFSKDLTVYLDKPHTVHALFIRAPRIESIHSAEVQVLADTPVMVRQGNYLATTFHPELTNDPCIHHYFVEICKGKQSPQQPSKTTPTKSFQMT
ncbi:MAG: Pyridoxal 5'-phosphate synthase subunit PdxT [Chlamydiales bacterium]|nr:Pyridoxal 5'-phosphate synthase subunit PdxT [Chlamydiales bacterium]